MEYLFLNFFDRLNVNPPKDTQEQYVRSLAKQYEALRQRSGKALPESLQGFVSVFFPRNVEKTYGIVFPALDRDALEKGNISNVFVRSAENRGGSVIPRGSEVFLVGDVSFSDRAAVLNVRGIEIIDVSATGNAGYTVRAAAECAFDGVRRYGEPNTSPAFDFRGKASVLTPENIKSICGKSRPVSDGAFETAGKKIDELTGYIDFRWHYLGVQSAAGVKISGVRPCDSYRITKEIFRANRDRYEGHILDGMKDFRDGDQVILDADIYGAEEFSLVCVDVEKSRKEILSETDKSGKSPKFESWLETFARESVGLSSSFDPDAAQSGGRAGVAASSPEYKLGEVFSFSFEDLPPDFSALDEKCRLDCESKDREIDLKYEGIVNSKVKEFLGGVDGELLSGDTAPDAFPDDGGPSGEEEEELSRIEKEKRTELELQYGPMAEAEKRIARKALLEECDKVKAEREAEDTVRRYHIYFRPMGLSRHLYSDSQADRYSTVVEDLGNVRANYLVYDNSFERTLLERQDKALSDLKTGNVRNPYVVTYLFEPEALSVIDDSAAADPEWILPNLNGGQKTAVKRAMESCGLFLLQGPPGTGKTQVIAELTAQMVKEGRKVLVSSHTHKAVDNVFERLPKIPEIRPVRLNAAWGKTNNYSIERLTDNFYENISEKLNVRVKSTEDYEEFSRSYNRDMDALESDYRNLQSLQKKYAGFESQIEELSAEIGRYTVKIDEAKAEEDSLRDQIDKNERTKAALESFDFSADEESVEAEYVNKFREGIESVLGGCDVLKKVSAENAGKVFGCDEEKIYDEVTAIQRSGVDFETQRRRDEIMRKMEVLRASSASFARGNPDYDAYAEYRDELAEIDRTVELVSSVFDYDSSAISAFLPQGGIDFKNIASLPGEIRDFRTRVSAMRAEIAADIDRGTGALENRWYELDSSVRALQSAKEELCSKLRELGENECVVEYGDCRTRIRDSVNGFFEKFKIEGDYRPGEYGKALEIIKEKSKNLGAEYDRNRIDNEKKIPIYRDIYEYLRQDIVRNRDRERFNKRLFDRVNVVGVTSQSKKRFSRKELGRGDGIDYSDGDIRDLGIDVVIVDEVSKSFLLDLVTPLLYGKTVILVGDHRQLPPMYDLRYLKKEDFENLGEEYITEQKNAEYRDMYERSVFKDLYDRIDESRRVMLRRQYRCHSQIMNTFNYFYGGGEDGLMVGVSNQDEQKAHGISVTAFGRPVIDPEHHVYFVNCDGYESAAYEGAKSKINEQEAAVAVELLNLLSDAAAKAAAAGEKGSDKNLSCGVICTYADQARHIKEKIPNYKQLKGFSKKQDEELEISTVDNFQGDERDIIIVSMVRNTKRDDVNSDFIKKFERINVAFSRARKLLIILGSRKFLSEKGVIYLPALDKRKDIDKPDYPVYKEIIDNIATCGRILNADDILGDAENG